MFIRYLGLWFVLALGAIANGALRELTYGQVTDELTAHQLSTATGVLISGLIVMPVSRIWPIQSGRQALGIGLLWLVLTLLFEFLFGHYVAGHAWQELLYDYNLLEGRVWGLFLLWVFLMPMIFFKLQGND